MDKTPVLFIQGGGPGAHREDQVLADSLGRALGAAYEVRFPLMPDEADPKFQTWGPCIAAALAEMPPLAIVVAHSLGGALLLKHLVESKSAVGIHAVFMLAVPAWDGDQWRFDELKLPADAEQRLPPIAHLRFHHCLDDQVVPFAHLALHGFTFRQASLSAIAEGGHQFGNDLSNIAAEITGLRPG